jgi:hypothetical protein
MSASVVDAAPEGTQQVQRQSFDRTKQQSHQQQQSKGKSFSKRKQKNEKSLTGQLQKLDMSELFTNPTTELVYLRQQTAIILVSPWEIQHMCLRLYEAASSYIPHPACTLVEFVSVTLLQFNGIIYDNSLKCGNHFSLLTGLKEIVKSTHYRNFAVVCRYLNAIKAPVEVGEVELYPISDKCSFATFTRDVNSPAGSADLRQAIRDGGRRDRGPRGAAMDQGDDGGNIIIDIPQTTTAMARNFLLFLNQLDAKAITTAKADGDKGSPSILINREESEGFAVRVYSVLPIQPAFWAEGALFGFSDGIIGNGLYRVQHERQIPSSGSANIDALRLDAYAIRRGPRR